MSLEDIIGLMKAQKEEQKADLQEMFRIQREEERKERDKEKEGLLKEIRSAIKEDVKAELKPLEEKTNNMENVAVQMGEKVEELVKKVSTLEEKLAKVEEKSNVVNDEARSYSEVIKEKHTNPYQEKEHLVQNEHNEVEQIFSKSAKVIGLKPIDKLHVEHIMRRQKDKMKDASEKEQWEAALLTAVKLFLEKEMRIKDEDYENLEIVKIFPPAKEEWNVLYVEFRNQQQANLVYTYTKYMRRNIQGDGKPEVQIYVPKELYARFRAISLLAFKMREDSGRTINTRITMGKDDFVLQQRSKTAGVKGWGKAVTLPEDLPGLELSQRRPPLSPGEAPGRSPLTPEQEERKKRKGRSSSGSSSSSPPLKRTELSLQEELAAAVLVSKCTIETPPPGEGLLAPPEVGLVTSVQGTPVRQTQLLQNIEERSPIISSRRLAQQQ